MNKSQSKYFNTAVRMDEAFLALLDEKDFTYITVKEICREAGVNRSTFYLHYETVSDLLEETIEYIGRTFRAYFEKVPIDIRQIESLPLEELYLITPQYVVPWLNFIKDNKRLFGAVLKRQNTLRVIASYETIFADIIRPILGRYRTPGEDQEYIFLFYVEGILGMVKQWLREECARPAEDIAALIMKCVKSYEHESNR